MNLMDLFIKIGVDDQASAQIGSISDRVSTGISTAAKIGNAAVAATGTALVKLAKDSISAYANFEQLQGGIKKLFGEDAMKTVMANADEAYRTAGMSANQYLETTTSFAASLIAGLKGDTEKAAQYSDMAIKDMSDNANTFGSDIATIQNAYQGFAKQNYTMLDNLRLGYGGTASEMARLINDSGVLGDTVTVTASNLNRVSFDKMIEAIHKVQESMGITGTTEAEAQGTLKGSIEAVKASWDNLMVSMIEDPEEVKEKFAIFAENLGIAWDNLKPSIGAFSESLQNLYREEFPALSTATDILSPLLKGLAAGFASWKVISEITKLISALKVALSGGFAIASGGWIAVAITAITAAAAGFSKLLQDEDFVNKMKNFVDFISGSAPENLGITGEVNKLVADAMNGKLEDPGEIPESTKKKFEYIIGVYGSQTPGNGGFAAPAGSAVGNSIVVNINGAQYSSEEELAEVVARKLGKMVDGKGAVKGYVY